MVRHDGPYEHGLGNPDGSADNIQHVVNTVRQVDISVASFFKHRRIASSLSSKAVARRIVRSVGFRFDNCSGDCTFVRSTE